MQGERHYGILVSQKEMHEEVFKALNADIAVDSDYMVAVSTEYLRSLSSHGILAEVSP